VSAAVAPPPSPARADALADGRELLVVLEQVAEQGGLERVVGSVLRRWPAARVAAAAFSRPGAAPEARPAWADRVELVGRPLGRRRQVLAPLYAQRMARLDTAGARLVLSFTSHGWALGVPVPSGARHVCYRTGPSRPLTGFTAEYLRDEAPLLRAATRAALPALRGYQARLARRPHRTITPSRWSAAAIRDHLGVEADVVGNPVETSLFTPAERPRRHVLYVGRVVWHKRVGALLDAARALPGEPFVVAGDGPALAALRAAAPPNVRFTGWVPDEELLELYRTARALVHPTVEEFGLTMAEALATGTPVVAPNAGGALDVLDGPATGVLLDAVDGGAIAGALRELDRRGHDPAACRRAAERFGEERFLARVERVLRGELALSWPS
jgi:glycosyltransferase involved in cell wall biosynthesis